MVPGTFVYDSQLDRASENQLYKVLYYARYVAFQTDNARLAFHHVGWGGTDSGSGEIFMFVYPFLSAGK